MSARNVETLREIYAAFGRGDVPAILKRVADDTEWSFNVHRSDVPFHAVARGKQQVPRFLADFGGSVQVQAFEPGEFIDSGRHVIAPIHLRYVVNATGKTVDMDQLHWWTFNDAGQVSRLRHFEDTAAVLEAFANS